MSQDPDGIAGAAQPPTREKPDQPRELRPITWDGDLKKDMMDLRPLPIGSNEPDPLTVETVMADIADAAEEDDGEVPDPKSSSAQGPADSSESVTPTVQPSSEIPAKIAAPTVGKGSTPPKV